jgi:hypothetical protein
MSGLIVESAKRLAMSNGPVKLLAVGFPSGHFEQRFRNCPLQANIALLFGAGPSLGEALVRVEEILPSAVVVYAQLTANEAELMCHHLGLRLALDMRVNRRLRLFCPVYVASLVCADMLMRQKPNGWQFLNQQGTGFWDLVSDELIYARALSETEWESVRLNLVGCLTPELERELAAIRHNLINRFAVVNSDLEPLRRGQFNQSDLEIVLQSLGRPVKLENLIDRTIQESGKLLDKIGDETRGQQALSDLEFRAARVRSFIAKMRELSDPQQLTETANELTAELVKISSALRQLSPARLQE